MFHGAVSASVSNIEFSAARTSDRAEVRRLLRRRAKRRSIRRCRTGFHNDIFCPSLCGIRFWTEHCRPSLWSPLLFWSLPFSVWLPPLLLWSFSRLWQVSRLLSSFSWQLFALGSSPRRSSPRRWFALRLQSRFRFHFHCQIIGRGAFRLRHIARAGGKGKQSRKEYGENRNYVTICHSLTHKYLLQNRFVMTGYYKKYTMSRAVCVKSEF